MTIVIPARNEESTIGPLVESVLCLCDEVVVVDDASTDDTVQNASDYGAVILFNEERRHIAASILRGMEYAASDVVTMDAGGSHDPDDVCSLTGADLVIGSRHRYKAPWSRRLLSWLGSECVNLAMQTNLSRVTDCTSGFRFYSQRAVELLVNSRHFSYSYDFQIEALARIHAAGMSIKEVPVSYHFTNSHLRARDVWSALRMCHRIHGGKL